jgi:hypothetical protein
MSDDIKLTDAEAQFADAFGMTHEEFDKYKNPAYRGPSKDEAEAGEWKDGGS